MADTIEREQASTSSDVTIRKGVIVGSTMPPVPVMPRPDQVMVPPPPPPAAATDHAAA